MFLSHSLIYCCGFPSGRIGNFRGYCMQGESVAMAAHPALVLTTVTSRLAEGALGNSCTASNIRPDTTRDFHHLAGLDLKWCALTMLIPNHESFKARGGGEMSCPLDLWTHTDSASTKNGASFNVSQNLYYNRYSVEMLCQINTVIKKTFLRSWGSPCMTKIHHKYERAL